MELCPPMPCLQEWTPNPHYNADQAQAFPHRLAADLYKRNTFGQPKRTWQMKRNAPLSLHIPESRFRPGDAPDFAYLNLPEAGGALRPATDAKASATRDLAYGLVRVIDDEGAARGPWNLELSPDTLRNGLRAMLLTRIFDDRMFKAQRQGKTPFYMKCTGEEAVAVAAALVLNRDDMCFASYRQQGILIARDWPIFDLMCQIYSNELDRLKGRQLPVLYSAREAKVVSSPPATPWLDEIAH